MATHMQLDENGKPCKACNTLTDFQSVFSGAAKPSAPSTLAPSSGSSAINSDKPPGFFDEPPDSLQLGQNTWTFLHSVAAYYPTSPNAAQQAEVRQLLTSVSHFYPCRPCAKDFERYISENEPKVDSRENLSLWMCDAHNAVNTKLGKPTFDCKFWKERWREGWDDFLRSQK